ncbi:MAG: family 16 glycosylhydrolase [Phycisphaerae bacterium]
MIKSNVLSFLVCLAWLLSAGLFLVAAAEPSHAAEAEPIVDLGQVPDARLKPSSNAVTYTKSADGLTVTFKPEGERYPGLAIEPDGQAWDLSDRGHVAATLTNTGQQSMTVNLRVDNDGDWQKSPWNTEKVQIKPGDTKTVKVIFGYQHGFKKGYKLDPAKVVRVLLFTDKPKQEASFRIDSVVAGGEAGEKPPFKPADVRILPEETYLLGGGGVALDVDKQVKAEDGVKASAVSNGGRQALSLQLPAGKQKHNVAVPPPIGRWDLRMSTDVRVRIKNVGDVPVTPSARVTSDPQHSTDTATAQKPLAPGESIELYVPFAPAKSWQGPTGEFKQEHIPGTKGTGTTFASDKADAVRLAFEHDSAAAVQVEAITAPVTPVKLPEWVGQRPPVSGDWTLTLAEEFDGDEINADLWNIYTANFWDKRTHFSKDNVILKDGMVILRAEKKTGRHNDEPDGKETAYATGFLDTYGKWVQTYGYFESRMKLPTAQGLWPAFWLMPDRGPDAGPQWVRADTAKGGMEFDIMEYLSRWGPYRFNIAMHWDGYGKDHHATGSQSVYVQPDEDGFITSGLLWLPGEAVFYAQGQEVARWKNPRISEVQSYIKYTHVTGGWDNSPIVDDELPDDFIIDYVRVWQRSDLGAPGGPPK